MAGNLAFIGLSKVRESATFSGLPITRLPKRVSGVWIVDLKSAEIVSFIEFTAGIDEVFAVSILPHRKMEMFDFDSDQSKDNYLIAPEDFAAIKLPETRLEFAAPHFQKGSELFNENRKKEAIEEYKKALAIQSDYLPATFGMAVALGDLGRYDEAETMLKVVVEEDASIIEAYQSLGYVYYKKGQFETAKKQFQKILELDSTNTRAKNSLHIVQKEMGEI